MRRTKKKAPKREPTKVVIQPGGSDNWSRFIIAAMALAFLVWFIHSQSERAALLEMASRNALMHDPAAAAAAGQYGIYAAGAGAGQGASQDLGFAGGQYGMQAGVGAGTEGGAGAGAGLGLGAGGSRQVGSDGAQWEGSSVRQEMRAYSAGMDRALSILAGTPGTPPGSRTPQGGAENDVNGHSQSQSLSQSQSQSQFQSQSQSQFRSQTQSQSFGQYSGQGQGQGQGQKRRWVPLNGSFVMRWGKPKRRYLETSVAKDKLETVFLDANRFGAENALPGAPVPSASRGPPCPEFEYSYEGFPDIASCWHDEIEDKARSPSKYPVNCPTLAETCVQETDFRPHEKWSAQVLVLHNVYVNLAGQIFNETHYFDHNECAFEQVFQYRANRTRVLHFKELVHMIDWYAWSARSFFLELLPLWVSLQRVLPAMRGVPVAFGHRLTHKRNQLEQMIAQGAKAAIGLEFDKLNYHILQGSDLFFSERLIVPLHQRCGNPSHAMWSLIRSQHFLPPQGLPMFNADYKSSYAGQPFHGTTWDRPDWVVLLAFKLDTQSFVEKLQLERKLQEVFPAERVIQYRESSLTIPRRKELLNRARFMISAHDNVLADMVFMPPGGVVLEIRPVEDPDPSFHLLAEVCGLRYYLLFSEGFRKQLPKGQAVAKMKVKEPRVLDRLLNKLGARLQKAPAPVVPVVASSR